MKRIRFISTILALSIAIVPFTLGAPAQALPISNADTISSQLMSVMEQKSSDSSAKIPVQIQLKDTVDYVSVEKQAMYIYNISEQEIAYVELDASVFAAENYSVDANVITPFAVKQNSDFNIDATLDKAQIEVKYEEYRQIRIDKICDEVADINQSFLQKYNIQAESVSLSLPDINLAYLTAEEIENISKDNSVERIDIVDIYETYSCGYSLSSADSCIRSNTSRNNGYDGTGVKIGVVEHGWANRNLIGSKLTNVGGPTTGTDDHATFVAGEIHTLVPGANIYLIKSASNTTVADLDALERLMTVNKVQVINMSLGFNSYGQYNDASRRLDRLVRQNKVTVVVAAGNNNTYVSGYGVANNVITVGSVNHRGYTTASSSTYTFSSFSDYAEASGVINKPDVCAPGENLNLYGYTGWSGTSMATPLITGIVAQMIDRNSGMSDKPQILKAAVMASCYFNARTGFTNNISNKEGAGVVDANFTYRVAQNGRRWHFDFTPSSASSQTHSIYADYTSKAFRISIAWEGEIVNNTNKLTDYDLYIYKGNTLVASSTGVRNNEVIIIPASKIAQYGAGYYTAKIVRYGTAKTSSDRVGLAWEQ